MADETDWLTQNRHGGENIVYLRSKGKFLDQNSSAQVDGLMCVIFNIPVRERQWKMRSVCFMSKSGEFAVADERGQVFVLSIADNTYKAVRMASTAVAACEFVNSRNDEIIISYENGLVLVLDTQTRDIIQNISIQPTSMATVRQLRTHPSLPLALLVSDDKHIFLWDLRKGQNVRTMVCAERIIAVDFVLDGKYISVTLEITGCYLYSTDDSAIMVHVTLPSR